jgi:hypothetical protein
MLLPATTSEPATACNAAKSVLASEPVKLIW